MEDARIERSSEQIIGSSDRVDVAREVEIKFLHGNNLTIPAAGGAPLDAECGALTWLPHAGKNFPAEMRSQGLTEADRGGRLALAKRRWRDRGDHNVLSVRDVLQPFAYRGRCTLALVLP